MDTPFVIEQVYDAPTEKVWQALTTESRLREWYFHQLTKFEPLIGFEFQFTDDDSAFENIGG